MEEMKIDNGVMEQEDKERKRALINARDYNSWSLTYLKGVKYVLLDYIDGEFEDDPAVAYVIIEELLDKSINNTIELNRLLGGRAWIQKLKK